MAARRIGFHVFCLATFTFLGSSAVGQPPGEPPFGPRGPGGFGGPFQQERKIVSQFDKDKNGWLNNDERKEARAFLKNDRQGGFGPRGGMRGFGRPNEEPVKPGPKVDPADVKTFAKAGLYEPTVLRTFFLEFENKDWESELEDFHGTDVEVPATLTVDGKRYPNVGVHFRGMSSYMGVSAGHKRSFNLTLDLVDSKQRLYGYKTLNLLNGHEDASLLSTVLYSHIARQYIPAPKANMAKVVINGESWGLYSNVQQFNKEFIAENYKNAKGARWKVRGNPGAASGLEYNGNNVEDYKRRFQIKSEDKASDWKDLISLCRVLNQTPPDKLEEALKPILDIDGVLKFLALDIALINCDGYWIRSSDFSIYKDDAGKFHIIPHDMNEAFRPAMGPGFGGMAFRLPPPGELLPGFLMDMLRFSEDQKKDLSALQKEVDEKLAKILTEDQLAQWKRMREPMAFGGPPNPMGPMPPMGGGRPGAMGPPSGRGLELDPLIGLDDPRKPLRSKLLAVPALKKRYLEYVKEIAEKSLNWKNLGPVVEQYRNLIEKEVEADTRKFESFAAFQAATSEKPAATTAPGRRVPSLRTFADERSKYLLSYKENQKPAAKEEKKP